MCQNGSPSSTYSDVSRLIATDSVVAGNKKIIWFFNFTRFLVRNAVIEPKKLNLDDSTRTGSNLESLLILSKNSSLTVGKV